MKPPSPALPLDGRDPSSLVFLIPGSVDVQHHGGETIQTGFSFPTETGAGIGSGRNGSTFYMLDGVTNMDNYDLLTAPFPNADATQEFKVLTSNFGAQYGFAPSAVVSIATKSGTNSFHGGAFWYVRNNAMNATNWFSGQTDTLRRNQFGLFAGGPIKKDKLFFFANYQGTKIIWNSTDTLTSTPTTAMLTWRLQRPARRDGFGTQTWLVPSKRTLRPAIPTSSTPALQLPRANTLRRHPAAQRFQCSYRRPRSILRVKA